MKMKTVAAKEAPIADARIRHLDAMRAFAIVMVVGTHAIGYSPQMPGPVHETVSFLVRAIAVPVFFLVDGFLFAQMSIAKPQVTYWSYLKKSATRLLVPWFVFTIAYSLIRYLFELRGFFNHNLIVGQQFLTVLKYSYGSVVAPQLYFLFSLFLIRVLHPITKKLLHLKRVAVLLFSFIYILCYYTLIQFINPYLSIPGGQEPVLHALWGFQFYLIGITLYLCKAAIHVRRAFLISTILFCTSLVAYQIAASEYVRISVQYLYLLSFYFGFSSIRIHSRIIDTIGRNTMGIYLLHAPILLKAVSIPINYFTNLPFTTYVLVTLSVFFASYLLTRIILKLPFGSLLFGLPNRNVAVQHKAVAA